MTTPSNIAPGARKARRLPSLDFLRGIAILGILVMNVQAYGMPEAAYLNPLALGAPQPAEWWAWAAGHVVANDKFLTMLAIIFGASMELANRHRAARDRRPIWRLLWLGVLGMVHAYVLWFGDILVAYSLCGLATYAVRRWSRLALGMMAAGLLLVPPVLLVASYSFLQQAPDSELRELEAEVWRPSAAVIERETRAYRGDWLGQFRHRVQQAWLLQTRVFPWSTVWRVTACMLLGTCLARCEAFDVGEWPRPVPWQVCLAIASAVLVGLPLTIYGIEACRKADWEMCECLFLGSLYGYWGSLFLAAGYLAGFLLICRLFPLRWLAPIIDVGRLALSNYLLQTLICTWIFYGHGLGWFGRLSRWEQLGVVVAVWSVQILLSRAWLRRFSIGPAEWLWRSASGGRWLAWNAPG